MTRIVRKQNPELLQSLKISGISRATYVSDLAQACISAFGGPKGFADLLFTEFTDSKSENVKAKILQIVGNMVAEDTAVTGKITNLDEMTDEDLKRALKDALEDEDEEEESVEPE